MAFAERCQLWLSRPEGAVVHRRRTVWGMTEQTLPLTQVTHAVLQRGSAGRQTGRRKSAPTFRAALVLQDGSQLALTGAHMSGPGPERARAAVNRWLSQARGVPVVERP
jgi:hypothetical protein